MPRYIREPVPGCTWFFTVVSRCRRPVLAGVPVRRALRAAICTARHRYPFEIDAWVLLPDHLHCIWTLPADDGDIALRWSMIKRLTTQGLRTVGLEFPVNASGRTRREGGLWQRRFWEHRIRDDRDLRRHFDYLHWNPVKHGYVETVVEWPWSSFHRWVRAGMYPQDWGGSVAMDPAGDFGEP